MLGRREIPNLWTQSESGFGRFVVCTRGVDVGLWLPLVSELAVGILQGVVEWFECNHKWEEFPLVGCWRQLSDGLLLSGISKAGFFCWEDQLCYFGMEH